jgi:hypothetical protein
MKWIDKNHQLPPDGEFEYSSQYVLVSDGKEIGIGNYHSDSEYWNYIICGHIERSDNYITHWMPLPELPTQLNNIKQ